MRYVQSLFVILSAICLGMVGYRSQQVELVAEQVRQDRDWAHRWASGSLAHAMAASSVYAQLAEQIGIGGIADLPPSFFGPSCKIDVATATGMSTGSGVAVGDGLILTAAHMVDDALMITVEIAVPGLDGMRKYVGEVVKLGNADNVDLALVRIDCPPLALATYGSREEIYQGAAVLIIGSPGGVGPYVVSQGWVASAKSHEGGLGILASNGIYPGNSGGAVYSAKSGRLIGILVAGVRGAPNVAFFMPIWDILEFVVIEDEVAVP